MFDFDVTLIMDEKFDYFGSLSRAHKVVENERIALPFEEFKQAYLRFRERLWNDPELRKYSYDYRLAEGPKLFATGCLNPTRG
jgi:hypothetical protein